jgi:hypothetical protein
LTKKGTFTVDSGTGNQTIAHGASFTPVAGIFWATRQTAEGLADGVSFSIGFTDGTNQFATGTFSEDAATTSNTARTGSSSNVIRLASAAATPTIDIALGFVSWDGTNVVVNRITNATNTAAIVHYELIGGSDITNAFVGTFTDNSSTGDQDITAPGFTCSDGQGLLFMLTNGLGTAADSSAGADFSLGVATSATKRGTLFNAAEDNRAAMDTWRRQLNNQVLLIGSASTGAQVALASFSAWITNGFRINWSDAGGAILMGYMVLKGGQYDVGDFAISSGTGNQDVTTAFDPTGLMLFSDQSASSNPASEEAHYCLTVGGTDGTAEGSITLGDEDDTASSAAETVMSTTTGKGLRFLATNVNSTGSSTVTNMEADINSFGTNKFTINKTTNDDVQLGRVIFVAFGSAAAAPAATHPGWNQSKGGWW